MYTGTKVAIFRGIIYRGKGRSGICIGYGVISRISPKGRCIYVRTDFCTSPITFYNTSRGNVSLGRRVKGGLDLWLV